LPLETCRVKALNDELWLIPCARRPAHTVHVRIQTRPLKVCSFTAGKCSQMAQIRLLSLGQKAEMEGHKPETSPQAEQRLDNLRGKSKILLH